ncbi:MAG: hypothetical protein KGZ87_01050 [Bacteroidetes bacterium]|nr:hypothetical protein [Bacteroidota bacterium]
MKKLSNLLITFIVVALAVLNSFRANAQLSDEFKILVEYLEANGNYINTEAPSMIKATEINENLKNSKYLVIDIRKDTDYDKGHIKGAVNLKSEDLIKYFDKKIKPENFEKITLVCYSGQSAAYYTGIMRLLGYNNVYTLKWGMSSWGKNFAQNIWTKNIKSDFADKLETTANQKPAKGATPTLTTGKTDAKEILKARAEIAIATAYRDFINKPEDVIANPENYYIVNYWDENQYNAGHIKGSVRYQPKNSLNFTEDLTTLPTDKKIIVWCHTGQTAAYVTAYLHMLGYDVGNLAYGANGFMNNTLIKNGEGWNAWTEKEINNFPVATKELKAPGCGE